MDTGHEFDFRQSDFALPSSGGVQCHVQQSALSYNYYYLLTCPPNCAESCCEALVGGSLCIPQSREPVVAVQYGGACWCRRVAE